MSYANKTLTCRDCGTEFVFTAGEQEFYAQKGFTNEPTRCTSCRQQRKQAVGSRGGGGGYSERSSGGGYSSGGYSERDSYNDRDSYSSGGNNGGYGGERRSGGNRAAGGEREMHSVTCAGCGKEAQVPFAPRGDRPVYCDACFQQRRATRW